MQQATSTEDDDVPRLHGAQTVHMPFGNVYTSLQTGVVDVAENGVNVYLVNKHYEVAPVLSMTEHEANNNFIWISDKLWKSLTDDAEEVGDRRCRRGGAARSPQKSLELEHQSADKLKSIGVKVVGDVDKSGFAKIAAPYQDKLAKELGPHAVKIKDLITAVKLKPRAPPVPATRCCQGRRARISSPHAPGPADGQSPRSWC